MLSITGKGYSKIYRYVIIISVIMAKMPCYFWFVFPTKGGLNCLFELASHTHTHTHTTLLVLVIDSDCCLLLLLPSSSTVIIAAHYQRSRGCEKRRKKRKLARRGYSCHYLISEDWHPRNERCQGKGYGLSWERAFKSFAVQGKRNCQIILMLILILKCTLLHPVVV